MNISFPGSTILFSNPPSLAPAGYKLLGLQNYGASSGSGSATPPPSTKPTGPNAYQKAYDTIITASNAYLQNSLFNGAPSQLPLYTPGSSASSFAQLSTTLAALKNGLASGFFQGTGFNALA